MTSSKLPPEALEFFRAQGAIGGKIGGKVAAERMTPEHKLQRARIASAAAAAARSAKKAERERGMLPEVSPEPANPLTPRARPKK